MLKGVRFKLHFGPYRAPLFKYGAVVEDALRGEVTIVTTGPNELMADIHNRMPVILSPADYDCWLDPEFQEKNKLLSLLRPYPADEMMANRVSTLVNSPTNDRKECVEPVE